MLLAQAGGETRPEPQPRELGCAILGPVSEFHCRLWSLVPCTRWRSAPKSAFQNTGRGAEFFLELDEACSPLRKCAARPLKPARGPCRAAAPASRARGPQIPAQAFPNCRKRLPSRGFRLRTARALTALKPTKNLDAFCLPQSMLRQSRSEERPAVLRVGCPNFRQIF